MGKVIVRSPFGDLGYIEQTELQQALRVGYELPTPQELQSHNESITYGTPGQQLLTTAEEAAGTLSFGGTRYLTNKLGLTTPEEQAARLRTNPYAAGIGTVGGLAAGVLLPGSLIAKGFGAVGKVGQAVAKGAAAVLPEAEGLGLVGRTIVKTIPRAAGSAVEGTAFGLGQAIKEDAIGDPDLTAQKVMAHMGYGALLGGTMGAGFSVAQELIPPAVGAAKESAKKLVQKIFGEPEEVGVLGSAYSKAASFISGKPEETILEALRKRASFIEEPSERELLYKEMADSLQQHVDDMSKASKTAKVIIRPEEVAISLRNVPVEVAREEATRVWNKVQDTIEEMEKHPALYPPSVPYKLKQLSQEFTESTIGKESSGEWYSAIDKLKSNLDDKFDIWRGRVAPEWKDSSNALKSIRTVVKDSLENENVWGVAGARQSAYNSALNEYLSHITKGKSEFRKAFLIEGISEKGAPVLKVSPNKVKSFLNQVSKLQGDSKAQALNDYIESSTRLLNEIETTYKNVPGKTFDKGALQSVIEKNYKTAQTATKQAELANQMGFLSGGAHNQYLAEAGAIGVAGVGHPMIGAAIEAFSALRNPALTIQKLAKIEKMANQVGEFIDRSSKAIFRGTMKVGEKLSGAIGSKLAPEEKDSRKKTIAAIATLNSDPELFIDHIERNTASLDDVAPMIKQNIHITATRATQFLASKMPDIISMGPLEDPVELSDHDIMQFGRYYKTVDDPLSVLPQIAQGTIGREEVETLEAVYPTLYQEMKNSLIMAIADHQSKKRKEPIPYKTKMGLSFFLTQDLDHSFDPQAILMNQSAFQVAGAPPSLEGEGSSRAPSSALENLNIASAAKTDIQKAATRKQI